MAKKHPETNKILLIPDVHGREFWKKAKNFPETVVFLGDYLDPYSFEFNPYGKFKDWYDGREVKYNLSGITKESAIENFKEILDFAWSRDNVVLLLGNHDQHYENIITNASRKDFKNYQLIHDLFETNKELFSRYYQEGQLLCTHAGVTKEWIVNNFNQTTNYKEAIEKATFEQWFQVSEYRGGHSQYSGPIWVDYHELIKSNDNEEPNHLYTDDVIKYQVFGHTMQYNEGGIVRVKGGACIDSRVIFEIDPENPGGSLKKWKGK